MADRGSYGLVPRLDTQQLFSEAQHRWLRPAEICEILRNYQKFHIASEPPNRPSSGSLFLFDRKVLRYFRKDGHNWRKKKDGKTVKEAHEKLKVGSVDVLHCYYAHGEDNENFQRRSYWMLEQELMHIVFVHYLEVKGTRTTNSPSSSFTANNNKEPSGNADSASPTSTLSSLCEDADSADSHQASSRYQSFFESSQTPSAPVVDEVNTNLLSSHFLQPGSDNVGQSSIPGVGPISYVRGDIPGSNNSTPHISESQSLPSWEEVFQQCTVGYNIIPSLPPANATEAGDIGTGGNTILGEILADRSAAKEEFDNSLLAQSSWQVPFDLAYDLDTRLLDQRTQDLLLQSTLGASCASPNVQNDQPLLNNFQMQLTNAELHHVMHSTSENDIAGEANSKYSLIIKQPLLNGEESLKKVDSFSRWISKELGEVDDLHMRSTSGLSWSNVECGNVVDESSLSPSLSHDQLFSIIDFSPKWAYTDSETEVHITGTFLKSQQEVTKCSWSCMFGEVEVPTEVLADGILCCYAPPHAVATVPFYVTCSNRLACSEVREFDYRAGSAKDVDVFSVYGRGSDEVHLYLRLERLLSFRTSSPPDQLSDDAREKHQLINKIISLKEEDESYQMADPTGETGLTEYETKVQLLQKLIKEKLYSWLLHGVSRSGERLGVVDDYGQGALHLAAALGCNWAIKPIVTAGVSINFRDVNGWTALHWAAFYGRLETIAVLVSLGAAPGLCTDPSPECPLGRTPADLASGNGHKGIAGFLAESSLTSLLSSLTVHDPNEHGKLEVSGMKVVQTIAERTATRVSDGDASDALSMKDSLTAMCNATQAASRIYQVFRMKSFQRKQLSEFGDNGFGVPVEHALSLVAAKGHSDGTAHAAATQIQKKFRGWKKRKEFLITRQRIVKIQALVRGHQVRKQYRTIIWSVGIVEKIILRWRRKRSGLRGFRRDTVSTDSNPQCLPSKEDDYDFLKEGRKQNEARTQIALNRVKSMYHNPEGRAQYRKLLTVCEGFRETKVSDTVMNSPEETTYGDEEEIVDIDSLLDDETFMSIAFE